MKVAVRIFLFCVVVTLLIVSKSVAVVQNITGFYMPTGVITGFAVGGTFLEGDGSSGFPGNYYSGQYHLGYDIGATETDPVYAITGGTVISKSTNGWGANNCCLVIRHRKYDGSYFLAFYGHVKSSDSKNVNDPVDPGEQIGTIGHWSDGDHLHFGVRPGSSLPGSPWGKEQISNWNSTGTNGFVDPIEYIYKNLPYGASAENMENLTGCLEMAALCGPPYSTSKEYFSVPGTNRSSSPPYCPSCGASKGGSGGGNLPTESEELDLPDFIMDSLVLKDSSGTERYLFSQTETIEMHSYSKNIGDADWAAFPGQSEADDIDVRFYLSSGYKEDDHDDWIRVGSVQEISKGNLDVGDTKHEYTSFSLATANNGSPLAPGVYNIVACVDRNQDEDNEDGEVPEKHKSNNCSTEAVFTVQTLGQQHIKWLLPLINYILD